MANAYVPPGVTVSEFFSPSVSPLLASPADVCIVGLPGNLTDTQTPLTKTDLVILSGTDGHVLPTIAGLNNDAQLLSVTSVTNVINPQVNAYVEDTDYSVNLGMGPPDGETDGASISRLNGEGATIDDGTLVSVTYTYVPYDYWNPVRLFDLTSVENRFGRSWADAVQSPVTGQLYTTGVGSQLSMGARLAFENGASSVVCQPLFALDTDGNQIAPTDVVGETSTWNATLQALRSIEDIDVLVPIIGADNDTINDSEVMGVFGEVQAHLAFMNTQQQYIVALLGEDGSIEGIGNNTSGLMHDMRTSHAPGLSSSYGGQVASQTVLINNTSFTRVAPGSSSTTVQLGGQYAAAAVAGALAARPVSSALTRKPILGFAGVNDPRTPADKNADAAVGMFVIESHKGLIRCRHAITLDVQNGPAFGEVSVVRSKHLMMESIRDTLDNQIIGNIIADGNSPILVRSAISSVLALLVQTSTIIGYTVPQVALTSLNPTTITASFSYKAAFPVNYVNVTFSLDMSTGALTIT